MPWAAGPLAGATVFLSEAKPVNFRHCRDLGASLPDFGPDCGRLDQRHLPFCADLRWNGFLFIASPAPHPAPFAFSAGGTINWGEAQRNSAQFQD
jgi:hypothetical protein